MIMNHLEIDSEVSVFLNKVTPTLLREAEIHSMIISLALKCREQKKEVALLARGMNFDGTLAVAGIQTDIVRPMIISNSNSENAKKFARALLKKNIYLPGVNGPLLAVDAFSKVWEEEKKVKLQLGLNLRLFELRKVIMPARVSGLWREATLRDEDLLCQWLDEFGSEAVPHDPKTAGDILHEHVRKMIEGKKMFLWEDKGERVCLVATSRETEKETWIAPVYTPKCFRARGYAGALLANVSQLIVERGKIVLLFTDLANPTSNSIYPKVGYRALADFRHVLFVSSYETV